MGAHHFIGNLGATAALPLAPPIPQHHGNFWSSIIVGVTSLVVTVLTGGILGTALAGLQGSLFSIGSAVLGGGLSGAGLGAGFGAGFIGNLAAQAVAKAFGQQEQINVKGALVSGLATIATAGITNMVKGLSTLQEALGQFNLSEHFNLNKAALAMEQNALGQGVNQILHKHQHFDWEQLAASTVTAGIVGGSLGKKVSNTLNSLDHNSGILSNEATTLTQEALTSTITGTHFNAQDTLTNHLGTTLGQSLINLKTQPQEAEAEELDSNFDSLYTDNVLNIIHPERSSLALYMHYLENELQEQKATEDFCNLASQDDFIEDEEFFNTNKHYSKTQKEYNDLFSLTPTHSFPFPSDPIGLLTLDEFYDPYSRETEYLNSLDIPLNKEITYLDSKYTFEEAYQIQISLKGDSAPKYWVGGKPLFANASLKDIKSAMDIQNYLNDPIQMIQFLDLHYQEVDVDDLNKFLPKDGLLKDKGAIF